jgi:hypothetical protein
MMTILAILQVHQHFKDQIVSILQIVEGYFVVKRLMLLSIRYKDENSLV